MYLLPESVGVSKLDSRWSTGHFLGIRDESNELLIATAQGVLKVRTVRYYINISKKWDPVSFSGIVGLPWEPVPGREGIEVKSSVAFAKETDGSNMHHDAEETDKKKARVVYISRADITRYKITPGCEGCKRANRGDAPGNHSDECRIRVERLRAEKKAPNYEKAMSRLAEEALEEDEQRAKKKQRAEAPRRLRRKRRRIALEAVWMIIRQRIGNKLPRKVVSTKRVRHL